MNKIINEQMYKFIIKEVDEYREKNDSLNLDYEDVITLYFMGEKYYLDNYFCGDDEYEFAKEIVKKLKNFII